MGGGYKGRILVEWEGKLRRDESKALCGVVEEEQNGGLEVFSVLHTRIAPSAMVYIARMVSRVASLTRLDLVDTSLDPRALGVLASGVKKAHSLVSISLTHNPLGMESPMAAAKVYKGLLKPSSLTELDLSVCGLGNTDIQALVAGAIVTGAVGRIRTLALRENELGKTAAAALVSFLDPKTSSLTSLDISYNPMNYRGAEILAQAVSSSPALTQLNLTDNELDNQSGLLFLKAAASAPVLRHLILSDNFLDDEIVPGVMNLATGSDTPLHVLDLTRNALSASVGALMVEACSDKDLDVLFDSSTSTAASPTLDRSSGLLVRGGLDDLECAEEGVVERERTARVLAALEASGFPGLVSAFVEGYKGVVGGVSGGVSGDGSGGVSGDGSGYGSGYGEAERSDGL